MIKQYKTIKIAKGDGRYRILYAPHKAYKNKLISFLPELQQKLHNIDVEGRIHGFMRGRSPVSNALKHVGYAYTLSLDLEDFFDSVKADMVKAYLSEEAFSLCFIDGIARQGLPTSPVIANLAFVEIDKAIADALSDEGVYAVYTRYADDLIFSFNDKAFAETIEKVVERIINGAGFRLNHKKRKLQSAKNGRRMITGIAVDNRGIHPSRALKRRIRAAVHQENRAEAFGLLSWAECRPPKAFYTDRDLLNKNIFDGEALDISNDFYLANLLSFEAYVDAVESDFDGSALLHEQDREKWEKQKSAFLTQREAFYIKEKKRAEAEHQERRKEMERHFLAEKEEKREEKKLQKETVTQSVSSTRPEENSEDASPKELKIDLDALKEIEQQESAHFQAEKKARRRRQEEQRQANEEKEEKKQRLNKLFLASILPLLILLGAMSYYFSATKIEIKEAYPLFIETVPFDAKIQIMNIKPAYKPGILLKPENYDIRISKKGYETQRFWIKMEHENKIVKRELKKVKVRKVY
ncbi:reverse transcriptase family protein [Sulfurimonas sp. HSL3-7]|uniref:reverse transcriptase family protein n=1 Tax=Sulfonitrofixus jiaomeiensis TaxID=3131938 RepID=UPI0031F91E15